MAGRTEACSVQVDLVDVVGGRDLAAAERVLGQVAAPIAIRDCHSRGGECVLAGGDMLVSVILGAQLTTPLRNLQPPRGAQCRMPPSKEAAPPTEGALSRRPDHAIR